MRLPSFAEECILLYAPMLVAMVVVLVSLTSVLRHVIVAYVRMEAGMALSVFARAQPAEALRCVFQAVVSKPTVLYIVKLGLGFFFFPFFFHTPHPYTPYTPYTLSK